MTPETSAAVTALGMDAAAKHRAEAQASSCLDRAAELLHQHRTKEALNFADMAATWMRVALPDEEVSV